MARPRCLTITPHLPQYELATRDRHSRNPVGRSLWHIVWLLAVGHHGPAVARLTGYAEDWERTIITGTPTRFGAASPTGPGFPPD